MTDHKPIPNRNLKEINSAGKIAKFYGFQPIISPTVEKQDFEHTKDLDQTLQPAEKAALVRMYFEEKMMSKPQPSMFYCERSHKSSRLDSNIISLGSFKSVCECLSIQTGISILNGLGYKNLEVEINSIGDKESMGEFQKKLTIFVSKSFQSEWPKPIDFLSESSRLHFKEVIEFLEVMNIAYQINNNLIGDLNIGSETIFSIKSNGEELAHGFRFNRLAKKIGCKKDLPATTLNIYAKLKKNLKKIKVKVVKPQFYLIQFGPEAKLKSFLILEELYKAGANVIHSIAKDKLGGQMSTAEISDAPYIILIGQKEALENSVVIRNTITRAQETCLITNLATKVKELV